MFNNTATSDGVRYSLFKLGGVFMLFPNSCCRLSMRCFLTLSL